MLRYTYIACLVNRNVSEGLNHENESLYDGGIY